MSAKYGSMPRVGNTINKKTTDKSRKGVSNAAVFLFTLMGVLALGAIFILVLAYPGHKQAQSDDEYKSLSFAEAIPKTVAVKVESEDGDVLGANVNNGRYYETLNNPEYMAENNIFSRQGASDSVVTLGFIGDILFDDEYAVTAKLKQRGGALSEGISSDTLNIMRAMDIMVVNNEFPYTERGTRTEDKQFTFRADISTASYLNDMGADVAILANNHVLDFGQQGLSDTLDALSSVGVIPVGAGRNIDEASKPVCFIVNDIKIAIVAATQIERNDNPNTIGATESHGGTFRCWTGDLIYEKIAEAKANSDFVIVCVHWGTEKEEQPDYYQLKQAPLLAQAGADLIIGDHPHILQGITYYGNTPCIYSLGNFWFNSSTLDTGIVQVAIDKDGLQSMRFIPAVQSDCRTDLAHGSEYERILNKLRTLSPDVNIDADGMISLK